MKVQNSCVTTSGRRADNDLNLRQQQSNQTKPNLPPDTNPPDTNNRKPYRKG